MSEDSALKTALYGESLTKRNVSGFTLSERSYSSLFKTPVHAHKNSLFCFVVAGGYTEISNRREQDCPPSTFLFHAAGDPHAEHFHRRGGHSFIVEIAADAVSPPLRNFRLPDFSARFGDGNIPVLGKKLYREFKSFDDFSPLIIEGLICEIIGEIGRRKAAKASAPTPVWLKNAEEFLRENFNEPLSLDSIAETVGVHPVHLAQCFRRRHQTTIGVYLRRLRLDYARLQLLHTDKPLAEIALASGFCDQSHFTRFFKREYGQTPNLFRQSA